MDSDNDGKVLLTEFGTWLFGQQMSKDEESLLKTAELKLTTPKGAKEGTGMNSKDSSKAAGKAVKAHGKAEGSGLTKSASTSSKRSDTSARDKHPQVHPQKEDVEDGEAEAEEEDEVEETGEDDEAEEDEEDEPEEEVEEEEDEVEDDEDGAEEDEDIDVDDKEFTKLSQTGRSALWQKLMPAREGSAQDAAVRMKTLKPPNSKRPGDHKHALLYLQNHAGSNVELVGIKPPGADRQKALRWLKDALLRISEAGDKSYQLPVKWLIGNYRLWPDDDDSGFVDLKHLAVEKLDAIGQKYEAQYVDRKLGMELGSVGGDLEFKIRPRQDHYLKVIGPVAEYFGLNEISDKAFRRLSPEEKVDVEAEHERKQQSSFIIFLLTAVHGLDHIFQSSAKEICESVGGTSRAPPPKGFMRMWAKLDTDHAKAESPRAAENIDTNRVAWIFEEPSQLRDAFKKAMEVENLSCNPVMVNGRPLKKSQRGKIFPGDCLAFLAKSGREKDGRVLDSTESGQYIEGQLCGRLEYGRLLWHPGSVPGCQ
eukprot:g22874.t1